MSELSSEARCDLLVVDDDPDLLASYRKILRRAGYEVHLADSGSEALQLMRQASPGVVLTDIRMPVMDGVSLLRTLAVGHPDVVVIMMTAYGTVDRAVETMKEGAFDFLTKPFSAEQLLDVVERASCRSRMRRSNRMLRDDNAGEDGQAGIIGRSAAIGEVLQQIDTAAQSNGSVIILGESGTGKELVAQAIHGRSPRGAGPFIALNCGALPDHLVESELFGHEKGAFTGAHEARAGLLETSDSGVFFLDEIGDLPHHLQSKLLRALEERMVRRLGGRGEIRFDARLVSATNRDVNELVANGQLRDDLYYRLNTFSITVPPLRERGDDIALLAMHFLSQYARECGKQSIAEFTDEALEALAAYHWPGNVRQLQHVVERAVAVAGGERIRPADLSIDVRANGTGNAGAPPTSEDGAIFEVPLPEARQKVVDSFERRYLSKLLTRHEGNVRRASQAIGMERKSLYRLLERHDIDPNDFRD